jgi:hypothetical protein
MNNSAPTHYTIEENRLVKPMPEIQVDFQIFLPSLGTFYSYFEILKEHRFIQDVKVVEREGQNFLQVYRHPTAAAPLTR